MPKSHCARCLARTLTSQIAGEALKLFGVLYAVEREAQGLDADQRWDIRQKQGRPAADALHAWLLAQRERVPEGSATSREINYRLGRWGALTRYLDDGHLPSDNDWVENQIRPLAIGRSYAQSSIMLSSRWQQSPQSRALQLSD